MKILLHVALLLLIAAAGFSEGFSWSAGAGVGVDPIWTFGKDPATGNTGSSSWTEIALGAFLDATYAQLTLNYLPTFGPIKTTTVTGVNKVTVSTGWFANFLDMALLLKYPFRVGSTLIFPVLGLEYALCLGGYIESYVGGDTVQNPIDAEQKKDLSDLYALAGLGVDFKLGKRLFLRLLALAGYNLTAQPVPNPLGMEWWGLKAKTNVAIGFKL